MRTIVACGVLAVALISSPWSHAAKMETWTDATGKTFKGEPAGLLGPYAVFRIGNRSTTSVRLRAMSTTDCVRYWQATRAVPDRADDWGQATSKLSVEIFATAHLFTADKIVRAELGGRAEPELFLLFYGWHDHEESWTANGVIRPAYERWRTTYPDLFETVFLGVKHDAAKNRRMIREATMPWLVTLNEEQRKFATAMQYQPGEPPMVVVVTRHGDFITGSGKNLKGAIEKTLTDFEMLLVQLKPNSARIAPDRKHYLSATQPVAFQTGRCEPLLIASPLDDDALRKAGVQRVDATIVVGPDHTVKSVEVSDNGGKLAPELATGIAGALQQAVFVAAVENGQFVEASFEIHLNLAQ